MTDRLRVLLCRRLITSRPDSSSFLASPSVFWHAGPADSTGALDRETDGMRVWGPYFEGAQLKMMRRRQEGRDAAASGTSKAKRERDGRLPLRDEPTSERIKRQVGETDEGRPSRNGTDGRVSLALCIERKG